MERSQNGLSKFNLKKLILKIINCELGKLAAGCLTNFGFASAQQRTTSVTSGSTITPNSDTTDLLAVTALGAAATIAADSGSPVNGQQLTIRLKDDGTGRALTWNAIYRAIGVTLPTTTVANKTHYIRFVYNSTDTKWDAVQVNAQA